MMETHETYGLWLIYCLKNCSPAPHKWCLPVLSIKHAQPCYRSLARISSLLRLETTSNDMRASVGSYSWAMWKENQNRVSIAKSSLHGTRRQLRKCDLRPSQPGRNLTALPDKVIQNTCQKFKILTGPFLKITQHSLFIRPLHQNNLWFLNNKYFLIGIKAYISQIPSSRYQPGNV